MDALNRLTELLDKKDTELESARETVERLERELRGTLDGWRREEEVPDDESLPLPRLELVYEQRRDWSDFDVVYRLVAKHLLGHVVCRPLSVTRISGGSDREPDSLPFRDGAHAAHDSIHLGLPCYRIMPGKPAELLSFDGYDHQLTAGQKHRRPGGAKEDESTTT